jgi:hypothetical protein
MGAGFAALAELMAEYYTVVTYDPRGSEHTTVTDRTEITTPELLVEDVHRVLKTISDEPEHLGLTPTEFPGDHGGFAAEAPAFAERLRQVLAD